MTVKPASNNYFWHSNNYSILALLRITVVDMASKIRDGVINSLINSLTNSRAGGVSNRLKAKVGTQGIKEDMGITRRTIKAGEIHLKTKGGVSHLKTRVGDKTLNKTTVAGVTSSQITKKTGAALVDGEIIV